MAGNIEKHAPSRCAMDSVKRHRLAATSSLAMLWTREAKIWQSPIVSTYLESLDLSDGKPLLSECNKVWGFYELVIMNRKYTILQLLLRDLKAISGRRLPCRQVVIMGAGMDPLSLELAARVPGATIYDVDVSNMRLKSEMIRDACAEHEGAKLPIHCITGDISNPGRVIKLLEDKDWDRKVPTVLVIEGISYYVPESDLHNIISEFSTPCLKNRLILEYLLTPEHIARSMVDIPEMIFGIISKEESIVKITRYAPDQMRSMISDARKSATAKAGADAFKEYTLRQMEKDWHGRSRAFKQDKTGWIRICHANI